MQAHANAGTRRDVFMEAQREPLLGNLRSMIAAGSGQ